jgi:hypothetical protein
MDNFDRLCGLVLSIPGYPEIRVRFPALSDFGSGTGPLSTVSTIEELVETKSSGSGLENQYYSSRGIRRADCATPSFRKSCH